MRIQDFCDMVKFEEIMSNWAKSTGLATVAVGADGKYISECYNFTEFCIDLTRGSTEGRKRCEQCDRDGNGFNPCHAGLVDFGIPITLDVLIFINSKFTCCCPEPFFVWVLRKNLSADNTSKNSSIIKSNRNTEIN